MTTAALKKQLLETIEKIDDNALLSAFYDILNKTVSNSKPEITPFSLEAFYARNAQSQKEIKSGKLISHKDVKKRFAFKNK